MSDPNANDNSEEGSEWETSSGDSDINNGSAQSLPTVNSLSASHSNDEDWISDETDDLSDEGAEGFFGLEAYNNNDHHFYVHQHTHHDNNSGNEDDDVLGFPGMAGSINDIDSDDMSNDDSDDSDDSDDQQSNSSNEPEDILDDHFLNIRVGEEDIYSEFSGDEKYGPIESNQTRFKDMFDRPNDMISGEPLADEKYMLTRRIRELRLNLQQGKLDREKKVRLTRWQQDVHAAGGSRSNDQPEQVTLSRLIVRGPDQPQELENSMSVSNHDQCANSLVVAPATSLATSDEVYTISRYSIIAAGVPVNGNINGITGDSKDGPNNNPTSIQSFTSAARSIKATKFLSISAIRYISTPMRRVVVDLDGGYEDSPMGFAHRYGYVAHGTVDGMLEVHCVNCGPEANLIYNGPITPEPELEGGASEMINSLQIVRWPRYEEVHENESDEDDDMEGNGQGSGTKAKFRAAGMYDHYVIMTGNEAGLFVGSLPDHCQTNNNRPCTDHAYKYPNDYTVIRAGFWGVCLNDAKASPDGNYIAVVGDASMLWVVPVSHVPESEEQKIEREEMMAKNPQDRIVQNIFVSSDEEDDLGVEPEVDSEDSEWVETDDEGDFVPTMPAELANNSPKQLLKRLRKLRKLVEKDNEESGTHTTPISGTKNPLESKLGSAPPPIPSRKHGRRLLHQFGVPQMLIIPDHLKSDHQGKKRARPDRGSHHSAQSGHENQKLYSSQYVAWNASSTKVAHTSDTHSKIFVWSIPAQEIVCVVDGGGPTFMIEFHPQLDNMFAFANNYGFVHVVDISGCCIGDKDYIPSKAPTPQEDQMATSNKRNQSSSSMRLNSVSPGEKRPATSDLRGCEGPNYEEKHDILMCSFRGESNRTLRILDAINGLGWSTDGRHLYVATKRRVLRYILDEPTVRIPTLFELCARQVRLWQEGLEKIEQLPKLLLREVTEQIREEVVGDQLRKEYKSRVWGQGSAPMLMHLRLTNFLAAQSLENGRQRDVSTELLSALFNTTAAAATGTAKQQPMAGVMTEPFLDRLPLSNRVKRAICRMKDETKKYEVLAKIWEQVPAWLQPRVIGDHVQMTSHLGTLVAEDIKKDSKEDRGTNSRVNGVNSNPGQGSGGNHTQ